jgi:uncharacterized protein (TIGR02118 family)
MDWTYEIALRGAPDRAGVLQAWLEAGLRDACTGLPGLGALDVYTPATGDVHDPYNKDGAGPLMILMPGFTSRDALADAVAGGRIAAAVRALGPDIAAAGAAFERRFYPVGDDAAPAPLQAPFSYVVRYHRPADDEAAFVKNYLASHPTIQARLPGIRTIMCYLPLNEADAGGLPAADYMIGNEVAFDDIAAFNAAMASPTRQELRAHFREFPRFTGANTHYPMIRRRLAGP